jgi:hypothetical protein
VSTLSRRLARAEPGQVDGIFVAAGHEAHVHTAIDFESQHQQVAGRRDDVGVSRAVSESAGLRLRALQTSRPLISSTAETTPSSVPILLPTQSPLLLSLNGTRKQPPISISSFPTISTSVQPIGHPAESSSKSIADQTLMLPAVATPAELANPVLAVPVFSFAANELTQAILDLELGAQQACLLGVRLNRTAQVTVVQSAAIPQSSQSLDAMQLQSLPLPGRDWQSFLRDMPEQGSGSGDQQKSPSSARIAPDVTVDGSRIQLAFGSISGNTTRSRESNLLSPASGDAAIREVQVVDERTASIHAGFGSANVETQRGTEHLHGQAFVFDRENLWGARNPFTQWVQETTPASATTVPLYTPVPFSPGDREALWGADLGGVLPHHRLFWFVALDGYECNDPGVATVKHPDHFFAQPSNDRMHHPQDLAECTRSDVACPLHLRSCDGFQSRRNISTRWA